MQPNVIVLGAGGVLGEAWMAGLLAGVAEGGGFDARTCDHFVGTSAGSIVAAGLAGGIDPRSRMERLPEQPEDSLDAGSERSVLGDALRFGRNAFAPLAALALRSTAAGGAALRRTALARIPEGRRSLSGVGSWVDGLGLDWDGRLLVATVEVETGKRVVFGGEATNLPVGQAVEASCAIPGVFRPIRANGSTYVDGGAWSLTNLDAAPVEKGSRVLCLNPTGSLAPTASIRGAVGPLSRSVAGVEALVVERRGATVTTIGPDADAARTMGSNFMDGSRRSATLDAGYAQGLRAAPQLAPAA